MQPSDSTALGVLDDKTVAWIKAKDDGELQAFWNDLIVRGERNVAAQGVVLLEFKRRLNHGEWQRWLHENWPKSISMAQKLMRVAAFVEDEELQPKEEPVPLSQPRGVKRVLREHVVRRREPAIAGPVIIDVPPRPKPEPHCPTCSCFSH